MTRRITDSDRLVAIDAIFSGRIGTIVDANRYYLISRRKSKGAK